MVNFMPEDGGPDLRKRLARLDPAEGEIEGGQTLLPSERW
jgi:hypothetical protein